MITSMAAPKTVTKALGLLELVRVNPGQRVTELAAASGVPLPTCSRLLAALTEARLIRRRNGLYELGPHCLALADSFREVFNLDHDAHVHLQHLAEITGETAHIGVLDHIDCVYVDKVDSPQSVRMYSKVGARSPLHSTGIGKALLSAAPDGLFQRVCEAGLASPHARTPSRTPIGCGRSSTSSVSEVMPSTTWRTRRAYGALQHRCVAPTISQSRR